MPRARRPVSCAIASLLGALLASTANAQTPAEPAPGFAIDRYNPAERGSEWFALDSLDLRGHLRPAAGVTLDYARKPLAIYAGDGTERVALIEDQLFLHIGGTLMLWDRLRVGVNFPVALLNAGTSGSAEGFSVTAPTGAAVGDLRLGFDVRLLGTYDSAFTVAAGAQVFLPTGSRASFTGDESIRLLPRLSAAGTYGPITYGAMFGVQYRALDEGFAGKETGTELVGGVSAGLRALDGNLVVGPELYGSTVIASSLEAPKPTKSPIELLLGAHYTIWQLRFGLGAGPGLTRAYGVPAVRVVTSVDWVPPIDTDGDGIDDVKDACVTIPGVPNPDPRKHGCPADRDGDGIHDKDDACVDLPGLSNADPRKHGCPPDRDGDEIYDKDDACLDAAGVADKDPAKHGCPVDKDESVFILLDRDKDTVQDDDDRCPGIFGLAQAPADVTPERKDEWTRKFLGCPDDLDGDKIANMPDSCPYVKGVSDKDPKKHGCPRDVSPCKIEVSIKDKIVFETDKITFSKKVLEKQTTDRLIKKIVDILKQNPAIRKLEIQGHASPNEPTPQWIKHNQELSEGRAETVRNELIRLGIEAARMTAKGYGQSRLLPGVPTTGKGKEAHQRVEFYIKDDPQCNEADKPASK
jgi:OmpA-OmpF porin, OOP family